VTESPAFALDLVGGGDVVKATNLSSAVMAQRHASIDGLDDFPTPPWGGRALIRHVIGRQQVDGLTIWEPAANRGFLVRGLRDWGATVVASDVYDYGAGFPVFDFLRLRGGFFNELPPFLPAEGVDWIATNPPFKSLLDFIRTAMAIAKVGVAMLCRTQCLEGVDRFERIFKPYADRWTFAVFVERIPMVEGRVDPQASSATSYGWLVVWKEPQPPEFLLARRHIPVCRHALEMPGDYR